MDWSGVKTVQAAEDEEDGCKMRIRRALRELRDLRKRKRELQQQISPSEVQTPQVTAEVATT